MLNTYISKKLIYVGIYESYDYIHVYYLVKNLHLTNNYFKCKNNVNIKNEVIKHLTNNIIPTINLNDYKINIILAAPTNLIWHKKATIAYKLKSSLIYKIVLNTISKYIPIHISDLYFDYTSSTIQQSTHEHITYINIIACKKILLDDFIQKYRSFHILAIDIIPNAILRKCIASIKNFNIHSSLTIYQDDANSYILYSKCNTIFWFPFNIDDLTTIETSCKTFQDTHKLVHIKQYFIISTNNISLNNNIFIYIHIDMSWIAEGLALWNN